MLPTTAAGRYKAEGRAPPKDPAGEALCAASPFPEGAYDYNYLKQVARKLEGENFVATNKQQPKKAVGRLTKSKIQPFGSYGANQAIVDVEPTESVVESSGSPLAPATVAKNVRTKDSQEAPDCVSVNIGNALPVAQSPRKTAAHGLSNKRKQGANQNASNHNFGHQDSRSGRPQSRESSKAPELERVGTPTVEAFRKKHIENMKQANEKMVEQQKKRSSRGSGSRAAAHTRFDSSAILPGKTAKRSTDALQSEDQIASKAAVSKPLTVPEANLVTYTLNSPDGKPAAAERPRPHTGPARKHPPLQAAPHTGKTDSQHVPRPRTAATGSAAPQKAAPSPPDLRPHPQPRPISPPPQPGIFQNVPRATTPPHPSSLSPPRSPNAASAPGSPNYCTGTHDQQPLALMQGVPEYVPHPPRSPLRDNALLVVSPSLPLRRTNTPPGSPAPRRHASSPPLGQPTFPHARHMPSSPRLERVLTTPPGQMTRSPDVPVNQVYSPRPDAFGHQFQGHGNVAYNEPATPLAFGRRPSSNPSAKQLAQPSHPGTLPPESPAQRAWRAVRNFVDASTSPIDTLEGMKAMHVASSTENSRPLAQKLSPRPAFGRPCGPSRDRLLPTASGAATAPLPRAAFSMPPLPGHPPPRPTSAASSGRPPSSRPSSAASDWASRTRVRPCDFNANDFGERIYQVYSGSQAGLRRPSSGAYMCGALEASAAAQARGELPQANEGVFTDIMGIPLEPVYFRSTPSGRSGPFSHCCTIM